MPDSPPVSLFYSYAHEDEKLRDDLERHLKILERRQLIAPWHDRAIVAGQSWNSEIDAHLQSAELVLLLLSSYFISSDYILGVELKTAMQRQADGHATVVPIMLRPVDLQAEDAADMPFVGLLASQGLPRDLKPVTRWRNREDAWVEVAKGLRATVGSIRAGRPAALLPPLPPSSPVPLPAPQSGLPVDSPDAAADAFELPDLFDGVRSLAPPPIERRPAPASAAAAPVIDPLLERVVASFAEDIGAAQAAKGGARPDPKTLRRQALTLIDAPEQKRVLWVDDHPEYNLFETAALAKLQVEVVAVQSTQQALDLLARDTEGFDLVISDWSRTNEAAHAADAGLYLLQCLRGQGCVLPFVIYHGEFNPALRQQRAAQARAAGALGEAVLPDQLLKLALAALAASPPTAPPGVRLL